MILAKYANTFGSTEFKKKISKLQKVLNRGTQIA